MTGINWVRVVVGGLLAGFIINVSGFLMAHFVLGREYVEAFKAKMAPQPDVAMFVKHLGLRFWFGLLAVFIYAGFRARFGPGPRTAILAAATVFFTAGVVMLMSVHDLGLLTGRRFWYSAVWAFVELAIATMAGAWLYREAA